MNKSFNISPNQVKIIFIIHKDYEDRFLSFLFDETQYSWIERDFNTVSEKLETIGTLLLKDNDDRLKNVFRTFYEIPGTIYYFVGTNHLCTEANIKPLSHAIYTNKTEWKDFNDFYKRMYKISFNEEIKEIR